MIADALILIVEDDPISRKVLSKIVGKLCRIKLAQDGEEALRMIREEKPDLILTDILMPRMDGLELLHSLKADLVYRNISVILITVKNDDEHIQKGFEEGAVDYVRKPFSAVELEARLKTHLNLANAYKKLEQQNLSLKWMLRDIKDIGVALSEDIKIPINLLGSSLRALQTPNGVQDSALVLEQSIETVQRVHNMVDDLEKYLDVAGEHASDEVVDLNEIVGEALRNLDYEIQKTKSQIEVQVLPRVEGNRIQYLHVFQNIISNALKYKDPTKEFSLKIGFEKTHWGDEIFVQDNGVGVPNEIKQRLSGSDARCVVGSEIGLTLCKRILVRYGASMRIEEKKGKGTTIFLRFERYF